MTLTLDRGYKTVGLAAGLLAIVLTVGGFVGRASVGANTVKTHSESITQLQKEVKNLEQAGGQMAIIAAEMRAFNESNVQGHRDLKQSLDRLADEFHAWQRQRDLLTARK